MTVLARLRGISGLIPLSFAIFYTNICIGIKLKMCERCFKCGIDTIEIYSICFFTFSAIDASVVLYLARTLSLQSVTNITLAALETIWSIALATCSNV